MGRAVLAYEDDTFEEPDIGPLAFALVEPGLTLIFGLDGRVKRELNGAIRDRPFEQDTTPAPLSEPVNRGADKDAAPVGAFDPMSAEAPRVEPVERFTFSYVRALMRHKVEGRDGSPLSGGGGSGRKLPKKNVAITAQLPQDIREDERVGRMRIAGLTQGERLFYDRRPNCAREVMRELVGVIIRDNEFKEPRVKSARLSFAFEVFGLTDPELSVLRNYRNAVRQALIAYAHDHAGAQDALLRQERQLRV